MTPIGELRLAIPLGIAFYNLVWWQAFLVAVLGNITAVLFIFLLLEPISKLRLLKPIFSWLFKYTRDKHTDRVFNKGVWALFFFTAIPLPITGGWTASLVAFVFDLPVRRSLIVICLGILTAGVAVLSLTLSGIEIEKSLGWPILTGLLLTIGLFWFIHKRR